MSGSESDLALAAMTSSALFAALDDGAVRAFHDACLTRRFPAGAVLFTPNESADRFFVVLEGSVKIYKLSMRGDEQILHVYGPGETFGEAAMWAGVNFPAHAEAVTDATVLVVARATLRRAIERSPDLAMGMMAGLSGKLREFNRLIEDLSLRDVPARLARVLLEEFDRAGEPTFRLSQPKRQLASRIGTTPETLSRALGKLKASGAIEVRASQITILDADVLARESAISE